jgi:hypothetical protein
MPLKLLIFVIPEVRTILQGTTIVVIVNVEPKQNTDTKTITTRYTLPRGSDKNGSCVVKIT